MTGSIPLAPAACPAACPAGTSGPRPRADPARTEGATGATGAEHPAAARGAQVARVAKLGDPSARVLAGPPEGGTEPLGAHLRRLGPLPATPADELLDELARSGLVGRGGGEFPLARKLAAALAAGGPAIVVANGAEGEPASRKDRLLLEHRPHLVLDGLALVAAVTRAPSAVVYLHAESGERRRVLQRAIEERRDVGLAPEHVRVAAAPGRFVAGETSAVVSFLESGDARPRRSLVPAAVRGVHGRPTIVCNVETLAHAALVARFGAPWFHECGTATAPGSTLVTLGGGVSSPGTVLEVLSAPTVEEVLSYGSVAEPPRAVLVGGYGGSWLSGDAAWHAPVDRGLLRAAGVGLGCGLLAPLPAGACGLTVTADLLAYLAGQSAGQCGSCVHGLPALAEALSAIVGGAGTRADLRRLTTAGRAIRGAGGCAHPDGALNLLESALCVFADDVRAHLRRRPCEAGSWFGASRLPMGTPTTSVGR